MNQKRFKGPDEAFKSDVININNKISKVSFVTKEVDLTFPQHSLLSSVVSGRQLLCKFLMTKPSQDIPSSHE